MSEALALRVAPERLTWNEICRRFPDEWVVLVDADWVDDHNFQFGTAQVYAHRGSRRDATQEMGVACQGFENVGCFFTGQLLPRFTVS